MDPRLRWLSSSGGGAACLETLGDIDLDALGLRAGKDLCQHDVRDLLHLLLGELPEDDDLVQPVQELWPAAAWCVSAGWPGQAGSG